MTGMIDTLATGYKRLLLNLLRLTLALLALVMVSAAVTLPVWFLAVRVPRLFNLVVVVVLAALAVRAFRTGDTYRPWSHRSWLLVMPGVIIAVAGLFSQSPAVLLTGVIAGSIAAAWRAGHQ